MSDLYEVLGIQRDADGDKIRQAYRVLAKLHHPDKGGDTEKFKEIEEAYRILRDPKKRFEYDQTGAKKADSIEHMAQSNLAGIFSQLIAQDGPGDMISNARDVVNQGMAAHKQNKMTHEHKLKSLERQVSRITSTGDINLYEGILQKQIQGAKQAIEQAEIGVKQGKIMLDMLEDYTDTNPKARPQFGTATSTSTLGGF